MLFGKTVLITGVSSGIGARTAELASQLGADIVGIDVRPPAVPMSSFIEADISSAAAIDELATKLAGYGWRQNLERTKGLVGVQGFPDVGTLVTEFGIKDAESYPVSKEALLLWTFRAAHQEMFKSRGIRVNAVSPGPVETPILCEFRAVLGNQRVDSDIARVGRAGTSPDIAPVIAFLRSDGARWINGANLPVDGGLEASINAEVLSF